MRPRIKPTGVLLMIVVGIALALAASPTGSGSTLAADSGENALKETDPAVIESLKRALNRDRR